MRGAGRHRLAHARVQDFCRVDAAPSFRHVGEVVAKGRHPLPGERVRERLQERMAHAGARPVSEDEEAERAGRHRQDHASFPASRSSAACRSGFRVSTAASGSSRSLFIRAGAVRSVNLRGSSLRFTSRQESGMETVPPATGRALKGPAMVLPYPFW